jgi:hypothetical protein
MRCYFINLGQIVAVEELSGLSDQVAVAKAHQLFSERTDCLEGFEVWDHTRVVIRHSSKAFEDSLANGRGDGLATIS